MKTTIAYGYDAAHVQGVPAWLVHPQCRETFLHRRRFASVLTTLVSAYHGIEPIAGRVCAVCKQPFQEKATP